MNQGPFAGMGIRQMGQPRMMPPQMGGPQMGPNQLGQPHMMHPQMGQPTMMQPQMGQPQMGQPQMGQPQMGQPQMGQPQMGQPQMGQPQMGHQQLGQVQILQYIRDQQIPPGWQQTYRVESRVSHISQILTQLHLVRPNLSMEEAFRVASEYEKKEFLGSPDQANYEYRCQEKLKTLTGTRAAQAMQAQNNPNFQQGGIGGRQHPMQNQAMFSNHQLNMNAGVGNQMPGANMGLRQSQGQPQAPMPMGNGAGGIQGFPNGQPMPNATQQMGQNRPMQGNFSQVDQQRIQEIAQNMLNGATQQDKLQLQRHVQNLPDHLKRQLEMRGMNSMQYIVRQQATQKFIQERNAITMKNGANQPQFGSGASNGQMGNTQMTPQLQASQMSQFDGSNSMDQILGQQQNAIRLEQAGQIVVPANPQQRNQQNVPSGAQKTPQSMQQAPFANMPTPNNQTQQSSMWNNVSGGTPNGPHMRPSTQGINRSVHGQNTQGNQNGQMGANNAMGMQTSQANGMPTLNKPMNPPNQGPNNNSPKPPPGNTKGPQRPPQGNPNGMQRPAPNGMQQRAPGSGPAVVPNALGLANRPGMPQAMIDHLKSLKTDEERARFVMEMRKKQQEFKRRQEAQSNPNAMPAAPFGNNQPPLGQMQQGFPGNRQNTVNSSQPAPAANAFNASDGDPGWPMSNMQQQNLDGQNQQDQRFLLSEDQSRHMDELPYPEGILNKNTTLGRVPNHIKTWGQLKEWVSSNIQNLPVESLQNVRLLQARHYQLMLQEQQRRNRLNQNQPNGNGNMQQPSGAPSAPPMTQAGSMPPFVQQQPQQQQQQQPQPQPPPQPQPLQQPQQPPNASSQMAFPPIPQPSMQEIQTMRSHLPPDRIMTDDQIRQFLVKKKAQERMQILMRSNAMNGQQQNVQAIQQQYQNLLRAQHLQQNANANANAAANASAQVEQLRIQQQQKQAPTPSLQWNPQNPRSTSNEQANKAQNTHSKPTPKTSHPALKRTNTTATTDDVVEVPDPKLGAQHQSQNQAKPQLPQARQANSQTLPGAQGMKAAPKATPEQPAAMTPVQRQAYENHQRMLAQNNRGAPSNAVRAPAGGPPPMGAPPKDGNNDPRQHVNRLREEVLNSMPPRPTQPMSPRTRGQMINKLRDSRLIINRIDSSLPMYLGMTKNIEKVKEVLRARNLLLNQVHDTNHTPVENFTISYSEMERSITKLLSYAQEMQALMNQANNKGQNRPPQTQVSQAPVTQPQPAAQPPVMTQPQHQQLNAANLQQQQEELQRSRAGQLKKNQGNKPPAAPTSAQAPVHLGTHSPHGQGVPQYIPKKNELTADQLQIPAGKRRKPNNQGNSAAGTPSQMTPGSQASPPAKVDSPEAQRPPVVTTFKCHAPNCKHPPFATQAQLERHVKDTHAQKEENITDPVGYVLESLRIALNLDDTGKSRSPDTKSSISTQAANTIKKESGTPTARLVQDLKGNTVGKASPSLEVKSGFSPDPWANTAIPRQWFTEVFRDVADLNRPVSSDFLTTWLQDSTNCPPLSPPSSTNLTDEKSSPHKSDISTTDNLNITIGNVASLRKTAPTASNAPAGPGDSDQIIGKNDPSGNWLPSEWFDDVLPGDMAALDMDGLIDMDWDTTFGKDDDDALGLNPLQDPQRRDEVEPSDEFLKAWAPEKLDQKLEKRATGMKREGSTATPSATVGGVKKR